MTGKTQPPCQWANIVDSVDAGARLNKNPRER